MNPSLRMPPAHLSTASESPREMFIISQPAVWRPRYRSHVMIQPQDAQFCPTRFRTGSVYGTYFACVGSRIHQSARSERKKLMIRKATIFAIAMLLPGAAFAAAPAPGAVDVTVKKAETAVKTDAAKADAAIKADAAKADVAVKTDAAKAEANIKADAKPVKAVKTAVKA